MHCPVMVRSTARTHFERLKTKLRAHCVSPRGVVPLVTTAIWFILRWLMEYPVVMWKGAMEPAFCILFHPVSCPPPIVVHILGEFLIGRGGSLLGRLEVYLDQGNSQSRGSKTWGHPRSRTRATARLSKRIDSVGNELSRRSTETR